MCMPYATLQSRPSLTPSHIADLRRASSTLSGPARRSFEAEMTLQYGEGQPLKAAAVCGWGRQTVARGLAASRSGSIWLGAQSAFSGRKRWAEQPQRAAPALRHLAEAHAQQAPTFRTSLPSTRLTAQAAFQALRAQGDSAEEVPSPSTMAEVRKRLGYRLRQVVKAQPQKQSKEPDALFDNIKKKMKKPNRLQRSDAGAAIVKPR
jgi:hypothetical protein